MGCAKQFSYPIGGIMKIGDLVRTSPNFILFRDFQHWIGIVVDATMSKSAEMVMVQWSHQARPYPEYLDFLEKL